MVPFLDEYHYYLGLVVYCVPRDKKIPKVPKTIINRVFFYEKMSFINRKNKSSDNSAIFPNICIKKTHDWVKRENLSFVGYLLKGDDTFIYFRKLIFNFNFHKIWLHKEYNIYDLDTRCHSEDRNEGPDNCKNSHYKAWYQDKQVQGAKQALQFFQNSSKKMFYKCSETLQKKLGSNNRILYQFRITDLVYVPSNLVDKYTELMSPFIKYKVMLEIALPNVVECIVNNSDLLLNLKAINEKEPLRNKMVKNPHLFLMKSLYDETIYLHPIKLSSVVTRKKDNTYKSFCSDILKYLLNQQ